MDVVRVEHVSKNYPLGKQRVEALKDVSLTVQSGEFMAIAGPSGSGKTTLLNLLGCIDTPSAGQISVAGRDVAGQTPDQLADLRSRHIGFIFQTFNLLPVLTAWENIEFPLLNRPDINKATRRQRVEQLLDKVGLSAFARHRPNELSGGQRQRVAIARALAIGPTLVLADEPTANLDHETGSSILNLMKQTNLESGTTYVFSTHDPRVMELADRVVRMEDGRLI